MAFGVFGFMAVVATVLVALSTVDSHEQFNPKP